MHCSILQYITLTQFTVWYVTSQQSEVSFSMVKQSRVQSSRLQYNTAQYRTAQDSTVQYSTVQYGAAQCSAVQCSTVHYTTLHSSAELGITVQPAGLECGIIHMDFVCPTLLDTTLEHTIYYNQYIILHHTSLECTTLAYSASHYTTLHYIALHHDHTFFSFFLLLF